MLPNVAEHGIGYPNLFCFFTNLMIYLLIASSCAENYPPAGICNMVLKTQYLFSKVKRLSKSSPRHMRKNVQPFAGENDLGLARNFSPKKSTPGPFQRTPFTENRESSVSRDSKLFMFGILASYSHCSVLCFKFFFPHMFS